MNYFNKQESRDMTHLYNFNEQTHYFTNITQMPKGCRWDVECTYKDKKVIIEQKERFKDCKTCTPISYNDFQFNTIYIEPSKVEMFTLHDCLKYYINYMDEGRDVIIFNFKELENKGLTKTLKIKKNIKIWDEGLKRYKYEDRYLLPKQYATVFHDGKIIQRRDYNVN